MIPIPIAMLQKMLQRTVLFMDSIQEYTDYFSMSQKRYEGLKNFRSLSPSKQLQDTGK